MSSSIVRDAARDLVNDPGWPGALPYLDTVSDAPSPAALPDSWHTLVFEGDADDPIGIGITSELRETGRVIVACFARSGSGDTTLIALAETAASLMRPHFKAAGIHVVSITPPTDSEPGVDGEFYRMDLVMDYQRDHS